MRIKSLKIRNFRGFEHKNFEFDERLVVIVGNNTAGKTSILSAIQVALGAFLNSLDTLPANDPAYRCNFSSNDVYRFYDEEKKDFFANSESTRIDVDAFFPVMNYVNNQWQDLHFVPISWWRELNGKKTSHSKACASQLIERVKEMEGLRKAKGKNAIFPIVLSFGSKRIDKQYRSSVKTQTRESKIAKAYKSALKETVDFQSAFDWLYKFDQNLKQGRGFEGNDKAFFQALETAIPAISDVAINLKDKELLAKVSVTGFKPEYQIFDQMSDGLKATICLVAEIAHRCIELNDFLGEEAVVKTPGIVLIDEMDLYLHPRWQRHILSDLSKAFPLIQFIVTSHSPFIIQSVKTGNVITLDGNKAEKDPLYRSIEEIAANEMNMKDILRSQKYKTMLEKAEVYYQLVKQGKGETEEAEQLSNQLDEIECEFSDDPAYVALLRAERRAK